MTTATKRITIATVKAFVRKHQAELYVRTFSTFDGMTDCVQDCDGNQYRKVESVDLTKQNTLGIPGVWFVTRSRDYFNEYTDGEFRGYEVTNSCGCFVLVTKS